MNTDPNVMGQTSTEENTEVPDLSVTPNGKGFMAKIIDISKGPLFWGVIGFSLGMYLATRKRI